MGEKTASRLLSSAKRQNTTKRRAFISLSSWSNLTLCMLPFHPLFAAFIASYSIKARRGGVGNHTCIHKYFVERSPLWQQIQEEARDRGTTTTGECVKPRDTADETTDQDGPSQILFDPIDSRHLSSLPLVKNRIIKLLNASRNHIHQSNNLLMTIVGDLFVLTYFSSSCCRDSCIRLRRTGAFFRPGCAS